MVPLSLFTVALAIHTHCALIRSVKGNPVYFNYSRVIPPKSIPLRIAYLMFSEHIDNVHADTYPMRDILVDVVNRNKTLLPCYNVTIDAYDTHVSWEIEKYVKPFRKPP